MIKTIYSLLACVALFQLSLPKSRAADLTADQLIEQGLTAERKLDPRFALEAYREADRLRPDDAFIQQKIAMQLSDSAFLESDPRKREQLAEEALPFAKRAVELDPKSAVSRLSLAVLYGKLAVEGDTGTKIEYSRRIRSDAEEAIKLDPDYAWAWHVLGRWEVEVSKLGMAKRAVIKLFYGGLPEASLEEGIRALKKSVDLEGDVPVHWVELGFAYQQANRIKEARDCWEKTLELPAKSIYDQDAKKRASAALSKDR